MRKSSHNQMFCESVVLTCWGNRELGHCSSVSVPPLWTSAQCKLNKSELCHSWLESALKHEHAQINQHSCTVSHEWVNTPVMCGESDRHGFISWHAGCSWDQSHFLTLPSLTVFIVLICCFQGPKLMKYYFLLQRMNQYLKWFYV